MGWGILDAILRRKSGDSSNLVKDEVLADVEEAETRLNQVRTPTSGMSDKQLLTNIIQIRTAGYELAKAIKKLAEK